LNITDPHALNNARKDLQGIERGVEFIEDPYQAVEGAHGIALITEWDSYKKLDYQKIFDKMEKPAFIFDGRNHLDHKALYEIGFNVYPIGKPALKHL
jgi:UDPglucose 6-dehydrogenase